VASVADNNNANSDFCVAPLQRAKSQKQLNTDPTLMHRGSPAGSSSKGASGGAPGAVEGKRISVLGEGSYCSQRWPSLAAAGVAGACSSQLMAAASAAGSGAGTAQQQRSVVCGTPHM